MGDRITMKDLHQVLAVLKGALEVEGINTPLRLDEGSKVNGRAFRLYFEDGTSCVGTSNGFLGWTKKEAYETMWTILRTIQDMWYLHDLLNEKDA